LAALWSNVQTGQEPAGVSPLGAHSGFAWFYLLFAGALAIGFGRWTLTTPFRDALAPAARLARDRHRRQGHHAV